MAGKWVQITCRRGETAEAPRTLAGSVACEDGCRHGRGGRSLALGKFYLPEWTIGREHYTHFGAVIDCVQASGTRSLRRLSMQARSSGCQL